MDKIFVEIGDVIDAVVRVLSGGEVSRLCEASAGKNKEDGFRAALMMTPLLLMRGCKKYRMIEEQHGNSAPAVKDK